MVCTGEKHHAERCHGANGSTPLAVFPGNGWSAFSKAAAVRVTFNTCIEESERRDVGEQPLLLGRLPDPFGRTRHL